MRVNDAIDAFREFMRGDREAGVAVIERIEAAEARAGRHHVARQLRSLASMQPCCDGHKLTRGTGPSNSSANVAQLEAAKPDKRSTRCTDQIID